MKTSWAFLEGSIVKFLNENLDPGLVSPALHGRWWLSGNILAYSYYKFPDGKSMATVGTSKTKNSSSYLVLTKTYFTLAFETLYIYTYIIYMYTSCGNTCLHPLTEPEILNNYNRNNDKPLYLKSAFTQGIWFHLQSVSPHRSGISQGSVDSFISFTLHSLPRKTYPHLWFQPSPRWRRCTDFYFQS